MTDGGLQRILEEHWAALGAGPAGGVDVVRTSELPVDTEQGRLLAAVDGHGFRHLLVPLQRRQSVAGSGAGAALRIFERPLQDDDAYGRYADITCALRELDDVFTGLCKDVLLALEADGSRPYRTALAVVDRWRRLFAGVPRMLSREQLVGLHGELTVLERLLTIDPGAVRLWAGPDGQRHDFTDGRHAVEVKSTIDASERRTVHVHGLDQLEEPDGGDLLLGWHRFEERVDGETLKERVQRVRDLCDDESGFMTRLLSAGYRSGLGDPQADRRLRLVESRWYTVDETFPRLTVGSLVDGVPEGVSDVGYMVDLVGVRAEPLEPGVVDELLTRMGRDA
ncbi:MULTISPECIES: PD-(D/E)XK motif protein [Streptomycetaceae]|uniref:PD-(D/E)XK motif protein n=1 Tax=Streptomycetaceae TaxID=2062 RepID=UPI0009392678|nr:PD-(D/E)XK motif protein [Streptomyces sp. CB02056]